MALPANFHTAGFVFASAQILILVLLVVGWGYWTWRLLYGGRSMFPFSWLFAGLAGYVAQSDHP